MTVTYTHKVANARLGGFSSLLVRWKGSVYKLFYKEFLIYTSLYSLISVIYRFSLHGEQKKTFEKLCLQFNHYTDLVPISFVLGFYVSIVVGRWWSQFEMLPFPDRVMMIVGANVHGTDDRGRLIRRTLLRYLNLAQVLTYRCVSTAVYKRFPTMQHVVASGIMTQQEYVQYESVKSVNLKYWVPLMWFSNLLSKVRQEGRIYDDMTFKHLMEELNHFRNFCGWIVSYDWISVPLVYTQVVTVAVYMFFMSTLLSRQYLDASLNYPGHEVDLYVPIFTIGQFFFYMGWLKVAEQLINPFGEDDDDFEVNFCIDRNLEVTMIVADQMYGKHPKLEKDKFWNVEKPEIPYTAAAANHKVEPYMGSTFDMRVDSDELQSARNFSSSARLTTVSEHSNEILDQKSGPVIKITDSRRNATPILRITDHSVRNASRNPAGVTDKIRLLDDERGDMSSDSDNDMTPMVSPRMRLAQELSHDSNQAADDDASMASDTAVDVDDEAAEGGDEKENDDDDDEKDVSGLLQALEESAKLFVPETGSLGKKASEAIPSPSQIFTNSIRKSPKKRLFDVTPTGASTLRSYGNFSRSPWDINRRYVDEERRNAEKRTLLTANRRKRTRNALPFRRRRPYRADYISRLWMQQHRFRTDSNSIASPEATSLYSETDIGSGHNADSPFGSILSCSTSIPSPRPLRFAFKPKTRNIYGDDTSLISSMPSPSGNDGETTDAFTPILSRSSRTSRLGSEKKASRLLREDQTREESESGRGTVENAMPFTEDLRRRLQIIPNVSASPSIDATSMKTEHPLKKEVETGIGGKFYQTNVKTRAPRKQRAMSLTGVTLLAQPDDENKLKKSRRPSAVLTGTLPISFSRTKRRKTIDANEKLSMVVRDCNNNRQDVAFSQLHSSPGSRLPRSGGSGLWNALKAWNAKRKETKMKQKDLQKQLSSLRAIQSEGDMLEWFDSCTETPDHVGQESKDTGFVRVPSSNNSFKDSGLMLNCESNQSIASEVRYASHSSKSEKVSPNRTISESEEGRIEQGSVTSQASGEVTWENECSPTASRNLSPTNRPSRRSSWLEECKEMCPGFDKFNQKIGDDGKTVTCVKHTVSPSEGSKEGNDACPDGNIFVEAALSFSTSSAPCDLNEASGIAFGSDQTTANCESNVAESDSESEADITVVEVGALPSEDDDAEQIPLDCASATQSIGYKRSPDRVSRNSIFFDKPNHALPGTSTYGLDIIPEGASDDEKSSSAAHLWDVEKASEENGDDPDFVKPLNNTCKADGETRGPNEDKQTSHSSPVIENLRASLEERNTCVSIQSFTSNSLHSPQLDQEIL